MSMDSKKLNEMESRCEELAKELVRPEITANSAQYQKLAKEHASLAKTVEPWRSYKDISRHIEENKSMLSLENDPEMRKLIKEETKELEEKAAKLELELKETLTPKEPEKNVIIEIRAGTGGEEAALFAADLFRMYRKYAESKRWKVETTDDNPTGIGGFKEIISIVSGKGVWGSLKYESGVHRVQRVPKTEAYGRIHTSAVTVAVLPEADDIELNVDEKDLRVDVFRASGPGGQGVNTTDSAVRITHIPTDTVVVCRDERSQIKNKAKALKVLKARLLEKKMEEQETSIRETRRQQVGTGDRSEKIRTYNFPQNRVTDHRIGLTLHKLDRVLEGELDELVGALRKSGSMKHEA